MAATQTSWRIAGEYFENCNCDVVCPCLFSPGPPMTARPTAGACEVPLAFHIERGLYGDVPLDGLNAVVALRTPGVMAEGNASVALYLDERANERQRAALQAIFSGAAGGAPAAPAAPPTPPPGHQAGPGRWDKDGPPPAAGSPPAASPAP